MIPSARTSTYARDAVTRQLKLLLTLTEFFFKRAQFDAAVSNTVLWLTTVPTVYLQCNYRRHVGRPLCFGSTTT